MAPAPEGRARAIWWWPWAVLLAGVLALKIALALTLAPHPLLQPVGDLDAGAYWRLAQRVAGGDLLLTGTPFYVSALYIYWLAFAQVVTGASVAGVLVLQAVLGTAAVALTAGTSASWVEPGARARAAVVAGSALALTGIVALQDALVLQSALDALLMALVAWSFTRALLAPSPARWAWCGAALALLATNRPNAWLLAPVCVVGAAGLAGAARPSRDGRLRAAGASVAGAALGAVLVLAPFTVRTALATGEWQVLPGHGGLNLYIGNHADANGTYTVIDGIRPSIEGQREDMRRVAESAAGRSLTDAQVSSHFVRASLSWWREAPLHALRLLAYKAWLTMHAWELPINVSYAWFREQVLILKVLPIGAWLLVPIGLAGVVAGHHEVPEAHRAAWRWFRLLLPVYLASVAIFFVVDRYRAPAIVLGAIVAGVLTSGVSSRWPAGGSTANRGRLAAIAVAAITLVAGLIPLPFQLGEAEADTRMALHAIGSGQAADARAWLGRAVARHPAPGVAWLRAGLAWQSRGELADAERALREAYRLDPDVGDVAFALAGVLITEGKGAEAVPLFEQAARAGVRLDRVGLDLSLAHWQAGNQARARQVLAAGVPESGLPLLRARALASVETRQVDLAEWLLSEYRRLAPGDSEIAEKLGLMRARRGDAGAVALLEEAVRLDPARPTAQFNLAVARVQQGRRDEAIALLREALRLDPTYAQAAGALRELLATP